MNFRITALFFALFLSMLWIFGLMIAHKKAGGDQTLIMPSLADGKIDKVIVKHTAKEAKNSFEAEFVFENGYWFYKKDKQKVRVEGFRIDNIVKQIKSAKHDPDAAAAKDLTHEPRIIVTLEGTGKVEGERKEWVFSVDDERAERGMVFVKVSDPDRQGKVFAVSKKSLDPLFFKDPNHLRSKRIFDSIETGVTKIDARTKDDGKEFELKLERDDANRWTFIKPPYGPAGLESEPDEKDKKKDFKEPMPPPAAGGVRGLLNTITSVRVDDDEDFVPLGSPLADFGLDAGKESMKIELSSANEKNEVTKEILYIGAKVANRKGDFRYARLDRFDDDVGVMQINYTRLLEPIHQAIIKPEKLRSLDVAPFDKKQEEQVDAVVIKQGKDGKDVISFFKSESPFKLPPEFMKKKLDAGGGWQMVIGSDKKKASDSMVAALIEQMIGKKAIVKFHDGTEEELKKEESKWGLDAASEPTEIAIFLNGIDKDKKADKKDDAKKDDPKKDEEKKDPLPVLKKDAKPDLVLAIGKIDGDIVHIRRTLREGTKETVTRFTMKKEFAEKVLATPGEGIELAYLSTELPTFVPDDVASMKLFRVTDKGPETMELSRRFLDERPLWYFKDSLAESSRVNDLVKNMSMLPAQKWKKTKKDEDYGMKNPSVVVTLTVRKHPISTRTAAGMVGLLSNESTVLAAICVAVRDHEEYAEELMPKLAEETKKVLAEETKKVREVITFEFGKEIDDAKEKATFAKHSGTPQLFLVSPLAVKYLKGIDLRNRSSTLYTQVGMEAITKASAALDPINALMFASPYFTGAIHQLDPEKVVKVRLSVRTQFELRSFEFDAKEKEKQKEKVKEKEKEKEKAKDVKEPPKDAKEPAKDKEKEKAVEKDKESKWTWIDKSANLVEFQVDPDKVAQLVKDFSKLKTERFVAFAGGPRGEHKLDPKEATLKLDLVMADGKTITVLVGASFQQHGYFATSSHWATLKGEAPNADVQERFPAVFFLPRTLIDPLLQGTRHFAKERSVGD